MPIGLLNLNLRQLLERLSQTEDLEAKEMSKEPLKFIITNHRLHCENSVNIFMGVHCIDEF